MSDSWQQVARGPTTLGGAADPIPMPPAVRVVQGIADLPAIRQGRLEMTLVMDDGRIFTFERDVVPGAINEIRIGP